MLCIIYTTILELDGWLLAVLVLLLAEAEAGVVYNIINIEYVIV